MGLDMFLYRAKKLSDKAVKEVEGKEIYSRDYSYLNPEYESEFKSLIPFSRKVNVLVDYMDTDKIKKDFDIPNNAHNTVQSFMHGITKLGFNYGDNDYKEVSITDTDMKEKYTITKLEQRYVVELNEIYYWRKNYELQDKLYELCDEQIENCGYHAVNEEMLRAINKHTDRTITNKNGNLFYHEWY